MNEHFNLLSAILKGMEEYEQIYKEKHMNNLDLSYCINMNSFSLAYSIRKSVSKYLDSKFQACVIENDVLDELCIIKLWESIMNGNY